MIGFPDDLHRFRDLLDRLTMRFDYRVYMTIGGELPASVDEQDGYLITGSPLSVLDDSLFWRDDLLDFIRQCDQAKKPLVGACFGHQAIALALGGRVAKRSGGYNVGIESTHFVATQPFMHDEKPSMSFYMFHEDEVVGLPDDLELIGSSGGCRIAAFAKGDHILPCRHIRNFTTVSCARCWTSRDRHAQDRHDVAAASLDIPTDGALFAEWMAAFLTGRQHHEVAS